jgi:hypothetical protein
MDDNLEQIAVGCVLATRKKREAYVNLLELYPRSLL